MEVVSKIKINLSSLELEIQGSEDFVNSYSTEINYMLERLSSQIKKEGSLPKNSLKPTLINENTDTSPQSLKITESFGEYFHLLPETANDNDKILIAGHFVQQKNEDKTFNTSDVTNLLLDLGIKLPNPSTSLKRLETVKKFIIKMGKSKYRVSPKGMQHIQRLLSGELS